MSDQTLWELAQSWRRQAKTPDINHVQVLELNACAFQLEQWAREKTRNYHRLSDDNLGDTACGTVLADLGVPEEQ